MPICYWPVPLNRVRVCVKTNVCHPATPLTLLFVPSVGAWEGGGWQPIDGACVYVCVPLDSCPALPHPPTTDPTLQSIRCTLPWCCFFYEKGGVKFSDSHAWTGPMWLCSLENLPPPPARRVWDSFRSWLCWRYIQMRLLWVLCWWGPSHEAGSPINVAQAVVTGGERVGQTAELITALPNERLWADILLC